MRFPRCWFLALALLGSSSVPLGCDGPGVLDGRDDDAGDDDTGDDDTGDDDAVDDDDAADDDDDTYACADGWEPLGVFDGFTAQVFSMAVSDDPPRLAASLGGFLEVYDLSTPEAPVLDTSFSSHDLGPWGAWGDVTHAPWGFAAGGESAVGPMAEYHLLTVEVTGTGSTLGPRLQLGHSAQRVAVEGDLIVAAGTTQLTFAEHTGTELIALATRAYPQEVTWINAVALAGDVAVVTSYEAGVMLIPLDPGQPTTVLPTTGSPQRPLPTPEGWLIPETGNFWVGCDGALELLDPDAGTLEYLAAAPCISAFDAEDGPFQAVQFAEEMFLANSESGILRFPWTPPVIEVPTTTTLTTALWPEVPSYPTRLERLGDVLFLLGDYGSSFGVVRICSP